MQIAMDKINALGKRITLRKDDKEIGSLYLYILLNDMHARPFGFIEDVFIKESERGKGLGSQLVEKAVSEARRVGCYKVIMTSRYSSEQVHKLYEKLGFSDHGKEFRLDL